jgi:hypothetical protein
MNTLVNALYPIFLGIFVQYLFTLKPSSSTGSTVTLSLEIHPSKSDIAPLVGIFIYYFLDWIICLSLTTNETLIANIISTTENQTSAKILLSSEALLQSRVYAFFNIVTVIFLGLSMLSSIGNFSGAFKFLPYYHLSATLADLSWLIITIFSIGQFTTDGTKVFTIGGPIFLYFIARTLLTVFSFYNRPNNGSDIMRQLLFWSGVIIHPIGYILLLSLS